MRKQCIKMFSIVPADIKTIIINYYVNSPGLDLKLLMEILIMLYGKNAPEHMDTIMNKHISRGHVRKLPDDLYKTSYRGSIRLVLTPPEGYYKITGPIYFKKYCVILRDNFTTVVYPGGVHVYWLYDYGYLRTHSIEHNNISYNLVNFVVLYDFSYTSRDVIDFIVKMSHIIYYDFTRIKKAINIKRLTKKFRNHLKNKSNS